MQKKTDKVWDKIVKRNFNNELEIVLEKKYFEENTKSLLLSILYKIEAAYKDYEKVKQNVASKEEFIENIIYIIQNDCDDIKLVKPNSEESKMIGNRTFLVEKKKKRIICYPIERKLLYSIAKIGKNDKIVKDKYFLINETLSNLINVGNNINMIEPLRDFNGYSWTTISKEIESIEHNIVYQNLRMLLGYKFLNSWVNNKEFIIDYMEVFKNRLEEKYGKENQREIVKLVNKISILLNIKFDPKFKEKLLKIKKDVNEKLDKVKNNGEFVQQTTKEKIELTKKIKRIDETINNKQILQEEYEKKNENLPLEKKIFSSRILSQMMAEEREEYIEEIEELNKLLTPQVFVKYKAELEKKERYLKMAETKNIEKDIEKLIVKLQNIFLKCYEIKIEKINTKQELTKILYEFRYYNLMPFNREISMNEQAEVKQEIDRVGKILINKANELKIVDTISKKEDINYSILQNIFKVRIISLEDLYIKVTKEKDQYFLQLFDETIFEEKLEMPEMANITKKDLDIKLNKKIKLFN